MLSLFSRRPVDHPLGFLVAVSGMLMQLMTYGIENSYSIFSEDMHGDASLGNPSVTSISLGNSVSLGLSPLLGVFAGFLVDRVPPYVLMAASTALLFAGLWISSVFATSITAVTFSYCLMASVASACMLSPGAAATSTWFRRYQGLAMGIHFCGGGLGSMFIPPIVGRWVVMYGWRRTFQLMSAFCSIGVVAALLSAKRQPDSPPSTPAESTPTGAQALEGGADSFFAGTTDDSSADNKEEGGGVGVGEPTLVSRSLHTHKLTPSELFFSLFTKEFMSHFLCWAIFSWGFFSLIYVMVPYVSSMGKPGTMYASATPIPTDLASTMFTFYGVSQIVGSVLVGWLATLTSAEFAYILCVTLGGVHSGLLCFARSYAAFAVLLCAVGLCVAGALAVMPALVARRLRGPNVGFFVGAVFSAGAIGGLAAPPAQAALRQRSGGYGGGCALIAASMIAAGAVCYAAMWPKKRLRDLAE